MFKQRESREINWNFNKFRWERNEAKNKQQGKWEINARDLSSNREKENCTCTRERKRDFFRSISSPFVFFFAGCISLHDRGGGFLFHRFLRSAYIGSTTKKFRFLLRQLPFENRELSINWVGKILKRARILEFREKTWCISSFFRDKKPCIYVRFVFVHFSLRSNEKLIS